MRARSAEQSDIKNTEGIGLREYKASMQEEMILSKVICNGCGQEISLTSADYFHGEKTWGYFSEKDGRQDCFDLCEKCFDKMTAGFAVKMEE